MAKIYGFPMKTFNPDDLLDEMLKAEDGQYFLLGEDSVANQEGEDTVKLVFAKIIKT